MSQLTNIPKQSYFSAQLQSPITAGQTTGIILTEVPSYTPSGETVRLNILDPGGVETITATGWNGTTKELSGVTRAIATYDGETATAYPHGAGITVVLSDDWKYFEDIATAVNSKIDTAGGTFTGPVAFSGASTTLRIPNLTEVQRDALVSPQNGLILYNTTAGEFQYYDGGAWLTVGTASVPNASETVAGIIELATASQSGSGTSTGETGARLVMPNSLNVTTSAGAGDAGKNPVLNASGFLDATIVNATSTPTANAVVRYDANTDVIVPASPTNANAAIGNSYADARFERKLNINTTPVVLTGTSETTLSTNSITGGTLVSGRGLRLKATFFPVNMDSTGSPTLTFRLKYGTTTVATIVVTAPPSDVNDASIVIEGHVISTGTNTQSAYMTLFGGDSDFFGTNSSAMVQYAAGTATENQSNTLNLVLTAQFSAAGTTPVNSITRTLATLELL